MKKKVVIVGAGLSGLAAALLLERRGCHDYILLEKNDVPGGLCASMSQNGYTFDYAGHFLHLDSPWVGELVKNLLPENLTACRRESRIYIGGSICHYPFQNNLYGMPRHIIDDCLNGFLEARALYGPPRPASEYASFGQWIDHTLGAGVGRHFMHPYNVKLWTVSTYDLTTEWMKDYVPSTSAKDIEAGAVAPPPENTGYNARFLYPARGGIGTLANAMAMRLNGDIRYGCPLLSLNSDKRTAKTPQGEIHWDYLFFSAPLRDMALLDESAGSQVRSAAQALNAADVLCLNLGLSHKIQQPYSWVYFPEDSFAFFRIGCYSNIMPAMAPDGNSSIYVEIAHRGGDVAMLRQRAIAGLLRLGIIRSEEEIRVERTVNMPGAYVIYDQGWRKASDTIRTFFRERCCHGMGRYGRWEYGDMEDCFLHARECSEII